MRRTRPQRALWVRPRISSFVPFNYVAGLTLAILKQGLKTRKVTGDKSLDRRAERLLLSDGRTHNVLTVDKRVAQRLSSRGGANQSTLRRTQLVARGAPRRSRPTICYCFARSSRSFKHDCLVYVIKRHNKICKKRIPDSAAVFTIILAHAFRIKGLWSANRY